ncbi:ring-cleaving dioxygenase [Chitinophaga deserti]|uniref:ring-cleaving dioxygenase n=1 Tax=Chitinophaga deserti TaxID=2164099 RepID=UPI000D6DA0C1|nr:ring-cleaving dioxygenase [Chitinophaga deserti]
MQQLVTGIHHITAMCNGSQGNIDFYCGILGLRLVKKTVNFDAPDVYHFYYGDESGAPGSIITFFPFEGIIKGRRGKGMLNTTTFSVPLAALDYWQQRLQRFSVNAKPPQDRFGQETFIYFEDPDGLGLELVFNDNDTRPPFSYGHIPLEHSIRGFFSAEIWEEGYEKTAELLTGQMDHTLISQHENRYRFAAVNTPGNYVDVLCSPDALKGLSGGGTVHHIAFATPDHDSQTDVRKRLMEKGVNPTPILDRSYFTSIYFREPGGVLFEIATSGPGFAIDETPDHLGEALRLPPQYEPMRAELLASLPAVSVNIDQFR